MDESYDVHKEETFFGLSDLISKLFVRWIPCCTNLDRYPFRFIKQHFQSFWGLQLWKKITQYFQCYQKTWYERIPKGCTNDFFIDTDHVFPNLKVLQYPCRHYKQNTLFVLIIFINGSFCENWCRNFNVDFLNDLHQGTNLHFLS